MTAIASAAKAWWLIAVLFITCFMGFTDRLVLSALVDPLRTGLNLTDSAVGLLQGGAFTVVYALASLPLGRLVDRRRRKTMLIAGAVVWCLFTALCGLAPNFGALFTARLFVGIGEAVLAPAGISLIADSTAQRHRGVAIGIFALGSVLGAPLGISIGGALLTVGQSGGFSGLPVIGGLEPWRLVLVIVGLTGLLAPALLMTIQEPERTRRGDDRANLKTLTRYFLSIRRLLGPLYLGMALLAVGDYGLLSWAPTALTRRFGWGVGKVDLAFGLITAAAGVAGSLLGGWFSDLAERRGKGARLYVCMTAAVLGAAGAALISANEPHLALLAVGVWVFASTVGGVGAIAALQEAIADEFRGTGASLFTLCNALIGLGGGPTLVALATEHVYRSPVDVAFAISTIIVPAALGAGVAFMLARMANRLPKIGSRANTECP